MNKKRIVLLTTIVTLIFFWSACNKQEKAVAPPVPGNEFITTLKLVATNAADSTDTVSGASTKLNPNDTSAPDTSLARLTLRANAVYNVKVMLLDETKNPPDDITPEILQRENYHLFCFTIAPALNLSVQRTDHDTNNPPLEIGLTDKFTTGNASSGNLEVVLHHQPNVKNGTCDPGSIDIDVNFTINIK
jgi:hypothetical protein